MKLIQADGLAARRQNSAIFKPLTFTLETGQYLQVSGPNGSGKTTALRVLAGLYDQYDGTFTCESVMYCGHRLGLDPLLNAVENLNWLCHLEDITVSRNDLLQALDRVGMAQLGLQAVGQLSQGQQRRVRMAHWLLSRARIWLLDEPLNALDSLARSLVAALVDEHLAAAGAVVCATHLDVAVTAPVQHIQIEAAVA